MYRFYKLNQTLVRNENCNQLQPLHAEISAQKRERYEQKKFLTSSFGFKGKWCTPVSPFPEILLGNTADLNNVILIRIQVRQNH